MGCIKVITQEKHCKYGFRYHHVCNPLKFEDGMRTQTVFVSATLGLNKK